MFHPTVTRYEIIALVLRSMNLLMVFGHYQKSFTRVFGAAGSIKAVMFEEKPSGAKEQNISTSLFAKKESLVRTYNN